MFAQYAWKKKAKKQKKDTAAGVFAHFMMHFLSGGHDCGQKTRALHASHRPQCTPFVPCPKHVCTARMEEKRKKRNKDAAAGVFAHFMMHLLSGGHDCGQKTHALHVSHCVPCPTTNTLGTRGGLTWTHRLSGTGLRTVPHEVIPLTPPRSDRCSCCEFPWGQGKRLLTSTIALALRFQRGA